MRISTCFPANVKINRVPVKSFFEACQDSGFCLTHDIIFSIKLPVNSTHRKTVKAIFSEPVPKNLDWRRVEALLVSIGCEVIEGDGSPVGFKKGNLRADFHRPHPGKEAKPYQVRTVREFLEQLEVKP